MEVEVVEVRVVVVLVKVKFPNRKCTNGCSSPSHSSAESYKAALERGNELRHVTKTNQITNRLRSKERLDDRGPKRAARSVWDGIALSECELYTGSQFSST